VGTATAAGYSSPPTSSKKINRPVCGGRGGAAFLITLDCECDGGDDSDSAYDSGCDPVRARAEVGGGGR